MINDFKNLPKENEPIGFVPDDEFNGFIRETINLNKKQLKKWKSYVYNEDGSKSKVIFDVEKDLFTFYNHIIKQNQLIFPVSCINDVKASSKNGFACIGEAAKQIILNDAPPEKFIECIANNTTNNHYRKKYVSVPKKY